MEAPLGHQQLRRSAFAPISGGSDISSGFAQR
jgi:hypothetical protein